MMVRNEAAIIADSVGHLLGPVGMNRVYVADNGSTDSTPSILRRIATADPRLQLRPPPGSFRQPEVMNALLQEAMADGAAWVMPNDADEFLWMGGAALRARCAAAAVGVGGFHLRVRNFVQFRAVACDRAGSIETMMFAARPEGIQAQSRSLVLQHGLPLMRTSYPPKLLLRAAMTIALSRGQHHAEGLAGALAAEPLGELLHAPIRSRDDLQARVIHGRRVMELAPDPVTSWHVKRLIGMDRTALDAEWRANSIGSGWPFGAGFRPDLRLSWLGRRLRPFRARALGLGQYVPVGSTAPGATARPA